MTDAHAASLGPGPSIATGIPTNKLGMWVFLASEVMFFTALIAAYVVLRMSNPAWPGPEGHISTWLGACNTFLLLGSSVTMVVAFAQAQADRPRSATAYLFATIVLGAAFLTIKGYEYAAKFHHGIFPSTNVFWSCYFALTGFHGLHVLGGVIANSWLCIRGLQGRLTPPNAYKLELAGLYWHFVDIVWLLALFPIIYLFN